MSVAAALALCALAGRALPPGAIDWQPALVSSEPWRAVTAIAVHYGSVHLAGNLAGAVLAGLLGWVAQLPRRAALAWLIAWPLTQLGLWLRPDLQHYGGLSGVLHAGVAVVAVWLVSTGTTRAQRIVGAAIGIGLMGKVVSEAPWGPVLQHRPGWDFAVAPFAHASGLLSGVVCGGAALLLQHMRSLPADRAAPRV